LLHAGVFQITPDDTNIISPAAIAIKAGAAATSAAINAARQGQHFQQVHVIVGQRNNLAARRAQHYHAVICHAGAHKGFLVILIEANGQYAVGLQQRQAAQAHPAHHGQYNGAIGLHQKFRTTGGSARALACVAGATAPARAAALAAGRSTAPGRQAPAGLAKLQLAVGVENALALVRVHPHVQNIIGLNYIIPLRPIHGNAQLGAVELAALAIGEAKKGALLIIFRSSTRRKKEHDRQCQQPQPPEATKKVCRHKGQ